MRALSRDKSARTWQIAPRDACVRRATATRASFVVHLSEPLHPEEQLRRSEERLRLLVESVRDYAIFMLDTEGRVATWNRGAAAIKQYRADEVIGRHVSIFYTPEDAANGKPNTLLEQALRDGRTEDEGWRVRKDGTRFWADVVITMLRSDSGEVIGYAKVTRDLTDKKIAEDELKSSEESLAVTLDSIGDAVIATDERGHVTRLNPVAAQLTGWTANEAFGRPIAEVFHIVNEDTRAVVESPVMKVLEAGMVVGLANHTVLISRDGSERPIADTGAPIRDLSGRVRGVVLVFRDVGEERRAQEQLRQSEEKLRLMISSVRDYAIFMLDPSGRVATWNQGAQAIKGYSAAEIIGQHFSVFYPEEDIAAAKPETELEIAARVGRVENEGWRLRKDGSRFWANAVISAMRKESGKLVGFTKVTRDMTERRRAEQEVWAAERLAIEERERTKRAEQAVRERDVFLSMAAHELRTPLTALQLKLQALQLTLEKGLPADLAETSNVRISDALRQSDRLAELVERLLDISRIAANRFELTIEELDLEQAVRTTVGDLREAAGEIRVSASGDCRGRWDPRRLEQVVLNLLSNAIKYGDGHPVDVSIHGESSCVRLTVADRGIGIAPEDRDRIFDPFERAVPMQNFSGLGLGLYITRYIVEAHGGSIDLSSELGNGATFTVTLPRR